MEHLNCPNTINARAVRIVGKYDMELAIIRRHNMKKRILFLLALGIWGPMLVQAQDWRDAEYADSDQRLNATYQNILARLKPADKEKLKKAQRAWIAFRDLDCAWAFGAESLDCKIDRTDQRTFDLKDTVLFYDAQGNYTLPSSSKRK